MADSDFDFALCLDLTKALIRCPSVTPADAGALDLLQGHLQGLGFTCQRLPFSEPNTADIDNLFARRTIGAGERHLCFAGHTDVVPAGETSLWSHPPFAAEEQQGIIYGRGAVDMKGAIACWITALHRYLRESPHNVSLSLLITGDEEGVAVNGTRKMLNALANSNDIPTACVTGEPTSSESVGDTIKHGRRGSSNFRLTVRGTAGHTGYPHLADNAANKIITALHALNQWHIDDGNKDFEPSHLCTTAINIDNPTTNIIPHRATANFNIRFNNLHSPDSLEKQVKDILNKNIPPSHYQLECLSANAAFLTPAEDFCQIVQKACQQTTNKIPQLSTKGGTSDSRFIKDYCPVVDIGLISKSMHKNNEAVAIKDLQRLTQIYYNIIHAYFADSQNE